MVNDKIVSRKYDDLAKLQTYEVAEEKQYQSLGNLMYETGRLQGADRYLWISPFIRYTYRPYYSEKI